VDTRHVKNKQEEAHKDVPLAGFALQHALNQTLGVGRDFNVARKAVLVVQNALVRALDVFGLVGRFANEHRVQDDAHGPDVDFEGVSPLGFVALNDFGCNVVGRPANGFALFVLVLDARREPEVTHFDVHVAVEKQVAEFEIAVNDVLVVHVPCRLQELSHVIGRFRFGHSFAAFDQFVETLVVAEF